MTTYYLCKTQSSPLPGRVVLTQTLNVGDEVLREIEADHWGKARESIKEYEFDYKEGYGYF